MPFGRGLGFRGWFPPWPYVGLGRRGLPRCWAYGPFWDAPYSYPYAMMHPYGIGAYPHAWSMGVPYYSTTYPYRYFPEYPYMSSPWGSPYGYSMTPEGEKEWLKSQGDLIQQQIDQINSRIVELEKK